MDSGNRRMGDPEEIFQKYEAMKEDYESLGKLYTDLMKTHSGTVNKLELTREEVNQVKKLYEDALQETGSAIREKNGLKQQCTAAIRRWDTALREMNEYKEALGKVTQQHEEAMKEINQAMAVRIKSNKDIKRLTEERDAALAEYSLIMSERDSVHRELEKLTDDLAQAKKQMKALEAQNKELADKVQEAAQEAEVSKHRREWAFSERDKIVKERESLRTLCDRLRRERDRAVSDLAEALSESEDIKKQKNLASKQLRELRERMEIEKETRSPRFRYLSASSSFSESRDSAIDSDLPSGHYSIKLPNVRVGDHGLVFEPGVYIKKIIPGSPAAKESNLNIGDRVLFINDTPIDNVNDAVMALSEDIDPIHLTLSRSAAYLSSPINGNSIHVGGIKMGTLKGNVPHQNHPMGGLSPQQSVQQGKSTHASNSSLKSDKSDSNNSNRRHPSGSQKGSGGFRDIFKVKLPRKILSSPEEATLATLDSAINSGGGVSTHKKSRKKRASSRQPSAGPEMEDSKNGTWPRVVLNRNSACSYTLPHNGGIEDIQLSYERPHYPGVVPSPHNSSVCIRRPGSGTRDRPPISSLIWDLGGPPHPAKSVGSIATSTKPLPHRPYSFGVFDPDSHVNIGQKMKQGGDRTSVVPTLTMSDGSSIDFSVKSGNVEILEYYVKKMVKNQKDSSESDHLDNVVTPPGQTVLGHSVPGSLSATLDRYSGSRFRGGYGHHHGEPIGPLVPLSLKGSSGPLVGNSYTFEPHGGSGGDSSHGQHSSHHHHQDGLLGLGGKSHLRSSDDGLLQPSYPIMNPMEPSGTFPRKREPQRIRIPSNQSVTSRSSTEKFDLRNSPMPTYHIEMLQPGQPVGLGTYGTWPAMKPAPGALRKVTIDKYDKSMEPLGIQIDCKAGGVFVSSVNENSLASQIGLTVGDQLLEVCGINMRSATYDLAASVLRQCGDNITILVQYLPDKYRSSLEEEHSSSGGESGSHSDGADSSSEHDSLSGNSGSGSGSRSGSPTPCNSPQSTLVRVNSKKNVNRSSAASGHSGKLGGGQPKCINPPVGFSDSPPPHPAHPSHADPLRSSAGKGGLKNNEEKPRFLTYSLTNPTTNLGVALVGGNVVGIFVHSVHRESIAELIGLRVGDQILEFNGTDLRQATAEEAALELAKPFDKLEMRVLHNFERFKEVQSKPGDSFYIRALFDYPPLTHEEQMMNGEEKVLSFQKDEILFVDGTMYNGQQGKWRAWKVNADGDKIAWGVIPSRLKVEEELRFKRSSDIGSDDRRSSTITRRSFFRRKSHQRSSSRELASFSDFSINSYGDVPAQQGVQYKDDILLNAYVRVNRLDFSGKSFRRPVVIVGALSDLIAERIVQNNLYHFGRAPFQTMANGREALKILEEGLSDNSIIDYKRKGSNFEVMWLSTINDVSSKMTCILDISTAGVERLQRAKMYPIILLVKFKTSKQIREIKDLRGDGDKINAKAAKELYEHSLKVESEYNHLITAVVPGGSNILNMANQVKAAIDKEQAKTLFVPAEKTFLA